MALNTAVSAPNPMFDVMVGHLCHAIRELFADYGITVERSEDKTALAQSPGISGLAVIGYAGEHVRGALVMSAAEQATRAWLSALGVSDGECADTLGEFSNMLLGRLKA
ncbi:MAG TPA: chemotaxis protein CheX, partial [Polyangiaceae bacterium]